MSMEKNRQREQELSQEIERLHNEIKLLQRNSEEGATLSQQLSKEVGFSVWREHHFLSMVFNQMRSFIGQGCRRSDFSTKSRGRETD